MFAGLIGLAIVFCLSTVVSLIFDKLIILLVLVLYVLIYATVRFALIDHGNMGTGVRNAVLNPSKVGKIMQKLTR